MESSAMTGKGSSKAATIAQSNSATFIADQQATERLAVSAYYKALARGLTPGGDLTTGCRPKPN